MGLSKSKKSRLNNLRKARETKKKGFTHDLTEFVFSILVSGLTFMQVSRFLIAFNQTSLLPLEKDYYKVQKIVIEILNTQAKMNCIKYQNSMKSGAIISIDGSWDHRRNGKFCIVEAFDVEQKKIVAFSIVERPTQKNPTASFKKAANQMEIEGVKKIIEQLKPLNKVIGYVHDKDAKTSKLFRESWNITEFIDPNHANKSFNKKFMKYNSGKTKKCQKGSLKGLQKRLSNFKTILTYSNFSINKREELWMNALQHFKGNHSKCIHQKYANKSQEWKEITNWGKNVTKGKENGLYNFLSATIPFVTKVDHKFTSQANEGFHSVKGILAPKSLAWGTSWVGRMAIAVLRTNEPDIYLQLIRTFLNLPLLTGSAARMVQSLSRMAARKRRYDKQNARKINKARNQARFQTKKDDNSPVAGYRLK